MYLKSLKIFNFRKFKETDNTIGFVEASHSKVEESPVASSTSLIIGKNNAGKTTVTKALEFIIDDSVKLQGSHFNYDYLNEIFNSYLKFDYNKTPELRFELEVFFDNEGNDIVTNIWKFINLSDIGSTSEKKIAMIEVLYKVSEKVDFFKIVQDKLNSFHAGVINRDDTFRWFVNFLSDVKFRKIIRGGGGEVTGFRLKDVIDIKLISATNNINDKKLLAKSFGKIIKFIYESEQSTYNTINGLVTKNNKNITNRISKTHKRNIDTVFDKVISESSLGFNLRADLTFDKLMSDLIVYEHKEGEYFIPEGQFGLGYANLIHMLSEIIDFSYRAKISEKQSKVQILCIEEPEVFMHPQMQINFIRHIEEALAAILKFSKKEIRNLKNQIVITTHSSHILNSVIQGSGTLNDINFIYSESGVSKNILVKDSLVCNEAGEVKKFNFIKKHIKHQVPELFFSNYIILVEGITEERFINFYIDSQPQLRNKNISVFRIDGAHGSVYVKLLKLLKIPSLIITDIDFKRSDKDLFEEVTLSDGKKKEIPKYPQMMSISRDLTTTNKTIISVTGTKKISELDDCYLVNNVKLVYQISPISIASENEIFKYYATSFEEALILENYDNKILHQSLKDSIPTCIKDLIDINKSNSQYAKNSYYLQRELNNKKTVFCNAIIFNMSTSNVNKNPKMPLYIRKGLEWLVSN